MLTLRAQSTPAGSSLTAFKFNINFLFVVLLVTATLAQVTLAQAPPKTGTSRKPTRPTTRTSAAAAELREQVQALDAAKQSANPAAILAASRRAAALAYRQFGLSRLEDGAAAESIKLYRRSLDFEGNSAAHLELAAAYSLSGQLDEAMSQTTTLLITENANAQAWRVQGQIWMMKQDYPHAVESLRQSAALKADGYTLYLLGSALLKTKELEKAKAAFAPLFNQKESRPAVHLFVSDAYRDAGDLNDAEREWRAAVATSPNAVRQHYRRGILRLARNQWSMTSAARSELLQEIRVNGNDFFGNYGLGLDNFFEQRYEQATAHLRVASEAEPQWPEPWLYLGLIAYNQGNAHGAEELLRKAIELTGGNLGRGEYQVRRAYYTLGRLLREQGRDEDAADCMRHLREIQTKLLLSTNVPADTTGGMAQMSAAAAAFSSLPLLENEEMQRASLAGGSFPFSLEQPAKAIQSRRLQQQDLRKILSGALNDLGAAEARQEQFTLALTNFQEAERWDAETPGLLRNLGMAAARVEDYTTCARALRAVVLADPKDSLARSMLGIALFTTNSFSEAANVLTPLGDSVLERPELAYSLAASLVRINRYQQAGELLDKLEARPLSPETMILVAQTWSQMANYEHTVATCHKALAGSPKLLRAHYIAALALIRQDRPADAARELRDELTLDSNSVDAQFHLAFVLLQMGQDEEAQRWLRSVLASNPQHPEANYELGKELYSAGQTADAIPYLEAAARLKPEFEPVHYQLQSAYRAVGRKEDADREAKTYRELKAKSRNITLPPPRETEARQAPK